MQSECSLYSKTCIKRPLKKKAKMNCQCWFLLNAGQKYCRMLQESILQCFQPWLSYYLSLRPLFCIFLSGRLRQGFCTGIQENRWQFIRFGTYPSGDGSKDHLRRSFFCGYFLLFMSYFCLRYSFLSLPFSLIITCWEMAGLLALVCVVFSCVYVTFPYDVLVRCGTSLYRFLIFAFLSTLHRLVRHYAAWLITCGSILWQ